MLSFLCTLAFASNLKLGTTSGTLAVAFINGEFEPWFCSTQGHLIFVVYNRRLSSRSSLPRLALGHTWRSMVHPYILRWICSFRVLPLGIYSEPCPSPGIFYCLWLPCTQLECIVASICGHRGWRWSSSSINSYGVLLSGSVLNSSAYPRNKWWTIGRGIGNALSAPIASGLLHPWRLTNKSHATAYGFGGYVGFYLIISNLRTN